MQTTSANFLRAEASRLRQLACEAEYSAADKASRFPHSDDARRLRNRASAFRQMACAAEAEASRMDRAASEAMASRAIVFDPVQPRGLAH